MFFIVFVLELAFSDSYDFVIVVLMFYIISLYI